MADLDELIREWTDQANQGVDPVELDAVLARAPVVGAASVGPSRRTRVLAGLTAAALVLAAVVAVSTLTRADDEHRVATEPEAPPGHVPSPYDLFPPGAEVTIERPRPADRVAWQEWFEIDIDSVQQVVRWETEDGQWLASVVGAERLPAPTWSLWPPTGEEHRGTTFVRWHDSPEQVERLSPLGPPEPDAAAWIDGGLVVTSDLSLLTGALDRQIDGRDSLGRAPGTAALLPHAGEIAEGELHTAPADAERWYTVAAAGRTRSDTTTFTFAAADAHDPDAVARRFEEIVVPQPVSPDAVGQRPLAVGTVEVEGPVIHVTVDEPLTREERADVFSQLFLTGEEDEESRTWTWVVGGVVILLLAGVTWRSHVRDVDGDVGVQVAVMRTHLQNGG